MPIVMFPSEVAKSETTIINNIDNVLTEINDLETDISNVSNQITNIDGDISTLSSTLSSGVTTILNAIAAKNIPIIKSIQKGHSSTSTYGYNYVSITSVDPDYSVLIVTDWGSGLLSEISIYSSTQIRYFKGGSGIDDFSWQVIEFFPD